MQVVPFQSRYSRGLPMSQGVLEKYVAATRVKGNAADGRFLAT